MGGNKKTAVLFVVALGLGVGCRPGLFRRAVLEQEVRPDRVVVFGTAFFDPPLPTARSRGGAMFTHVNVGLSLLPDTPFHRATHLPQTIGQTYAPAEGGAFIIEAPRETFYVRSVSLFLRRMYGGLIYGGGGVDREVWDEFVLCDDNLRVDPRPQDRHIYIGRLTCHHDAGTPLALDVVDGFDQDASEFPADIEVASRIAVQDGPLQPIDVSQFRGRAGVRARLRGLQPPLTPEEMVEALGAVR